MSKTLDWLRLAIRALRGYRTYDALTDCECEECIGLNRPGLVPLIPKAGWFPPRLNQPPFFKDYDYDRVAQ